MKSILNLAAVTGLALALAACGDTEDASQDAMADEVEMPADEAMADAPMPVEDEAMVEESVPEPSTTPDAVVEDEASRAAEDAQATVDEIEAAIGSAEESMETQ